MRAVLACDKVGVRADTLVPEARLRRASRCLSRRLPGAGSAISRRDPGPGKTTRAMAYAADAFKLIVSQGGFFVLYVPAGYYLVLVVDLAS